MALGITPQEIVDSNEFPLLTKHETWDRIFLEQIAEVQNGYPFESSKFTKNQGMPLIRIRDIDQHETENHYSGEYSSDYIVRKGDILIGMDGDFNLALWKGNDGLLNQRVCRIIMKSPLYLKKFLVYCLPPFLNAINAKTSSVTVKHLSSNTIKTIPLPFPPIEEQRRIVTKLEELFSNLDKGIERLKAAQQQLKIYRQSVLNWAFEGRFIKNKSKSMGLPDGWKYVLLGEIAQLCLGKMLDKEKNKGEYQPYLRNINVRWGEFDLGSLEVMRFEDSEKNRYSVEMGDLVVCEGGEPGRCAIWASSNTMYIQKALHRVRLNKNYNPKFIYYYLFYLASNGLLDQYFTGTTIKHLTGRELKRIQIVAPEKYSEQENIISQIESRLSICETIEERINQNLQQAEALRQSILKKAFEGKLLHHDPKYEPAKATLQQITSDKK